MKAYIFVRATPAILAATGGSGLKPTPCGRGENGRLAHRASGGAHSPITENGNT